MESIVVDYWGIFECFVTRIESFIWSLLTVKIMFIAFAFYCQYDRHSYKAL